MKASGPAPVEPPPARATAHGVLRASGRGADLVSGVLCLLATVVACLSFGEGLGLFRAGLAAVVLAIAPGHALVRLVHPQRLAPSLALPLAVAFSPFVLGVVMTALLMASFDASMAARVTALGVAAALGFDMHRSRRAAPAPEVAAEPGIGRGTAIVALVLLLLVALPIARSNRVRASIHGMLHASILYSAVDRGVPPENPFFAGEPLRYYWTFHVGAAAVGELGGIEPTTVFAAGNVATLAAFLLLLARLGADLFGTRLAAWLAVLLGFLGLNPLGAFLGSRRPEVTLDQVAAGTDPIVWLKSLTLGGDERVNATFTKFMNVSSFPQSFALLIAAWILLARTVDRPAPGRVLLAVLAIGGCIALSPITGGTAGLALGLAAAVLLATRAHRQGALAAAGALLAGLVAAAPFVVLGSGGGDASTEPPLAFEPEWAKVSRVLWNLGPLLVLALPAGLAILRRGRGGARLLAFSALPLLLTAVLLGFPVESEYKMVRMAAPLLGVLAAGTLAEFAARLPRAGGAALVVALLLPFLPTNALAWWCYVRHSEATLPYHGDGTRVVVDAEVHAVTGMYEWIRLNTPADAVILDNPEAKQRHFAGPFHGDEVPVLARRPIWTDLPYYMNDYEPALPARLRVVHDLFRGSGLTPEGRTLLLALRRPVYLLVRAFDPGFASAVLAAAGDPRWEKVAQTAGAALFRLRG